MTQMNEEQFLDGFTPEMQGEIKTIFEDAVEERAQEELEERMEIIAAVEDAANCFVADLAECEVSDEELDQFYSWWCEQHEIDNPDAIEMLAEYLGKLFETFTKEDADDLEEGATHVGSWKLENKAGTVHVHDRGPAYATLKRRFILSHQDHAGLHLATHFAGTAKDVKTKLGQLNKGEHIKEETETPSLMESYVRNIERSVGIYKN
jgi:hypothetical protein